MFYLLLVLLQPRLTHAAEPTVVIGIMVDFDKSRAMGYDMLSYQIPSSYVDILRKINKNIKIVTLLPYDDYLSYYFEKIDGIILTGSNYDVDPTLYGERKRGTTTVQFERKMSFERKLLKQAKKYNLPVIGICYGMQIMNVIFGGTLKQQVNSHMLQKGVEHDISIAKNSVISKILAGATKFKTNSLHHQAVNKVAPGFTVSATAHDGVIEAIEAKEGYMIGVQWHPERKNDNLSLALFSDFYLQALTYHLTYHKKHKNEVTG